MIHEHVIPTNGNCAVNDMVTAPKFNFREVICERNETYLTLSSTRDTTLTSGPWKCMM